ncbi:hypothetical protein PENTCL1PPCAC_19079 [Pristionchus entomophagus]|uniref:F-box domain-containing protein n=1 Tax=Pristionchus entomophagus TaxID=358040 RepID=A0AAV5TRR3_9BILA|nr:hypothetical protein PENTCL1PPCAC_19079 [Pristionchus entomophagus]
MLNSVARFLKGPTIHRLEIKNITVSDNSLWVCCKHFPCWRSDILKMLDSHEVRELSLEVRSYTASADPVQTLLKLATVLCSIRIKQRYIENIGTSNYLFGTRNVEWSRIILDIFSRKVDKLCIENDSFHEYLSRQGADMLIERLPWIGKKVWFETISQYSNNFVNKVSNDHVVRVRDFGDAGRHLRIKHVSRSEQYF